MKKFRAHGATLSSKLKASLLTELMSAGEWSAAAGKKATPPKSYSGARTGGAARPRSYAAVAAGAATLEAAALHARLAALEKAAATGAMEPRLSRQARRKARRVEFVDAEPASGANKTVAEGVGDHADISVEPEPPQWTCPACNTEYDFIPRSGATSAKWSGR